MAKRKTPWQNRIVGQGTKPASEFLANSANWRIHPKEQQEPLKAVLTQVGWVQDVIENVRTGALVDGHLRVMLALREGDDTPVPYKQVDLSPEEEALILATLDPLSALAAADKEKLGALMAQAPADDPALAEFLAMLAEQEGLAGAQLPEPGDAETTAIGDKWEVLVTCADEAEQVAVLELLNAEGYECRPLMS